MQKKLACYLCKKRNVDVAFRKLGYKIFKCPNCHPFSLEFKDEYSQFIKSYYQEGYFKGDKSLRAYANYEKDKKTIQKNMYHCLKRIMCFKKQGRLLDVGCAMGFFLELSQKAGFDSYGIDVSSYAVKIADKILPQRIFQTTLTESTFKENSFDVVTMFDFIEHLKDPIKDLLKIRKLLKDNGLLVIQTGDSESLYAKIMGKRWHFFAPPQHLFFFGRRTITKILKYTGFDIVKIEKSGKWVSLRYLLHMVGYSQNSPISDYLCGIVRNNFLGKIPLYFRFNDNMTVYAKKSL